MIKKIRMWRIISKAIRHVNIQFRHSSPRIRRINFYGVYDVTPQSLVIWYIFDTINDEITARETGLEKSIIDFTKESLLRGGYPEEAFTDTILGYTTLISLPDENGKITERQEPLIRKVMISFSSLEDIELTANGDWRMYFQ